MIKASLLFVISSSHNINLTNNSDSPSMINKTSNDVDHTQNYQYECIPEYLLTMTRHHQPKVTTTSTSDSRQSTCSPPSSVTVIPEESSTPVLASSIC